MFWDNPVPVVAAIVQRDTGEVLLARNAGWPEDRFGLVTGFLEPEETPEQGVLREVEEEIGLAGEIRGFVGLYPFYRNNQLLLVYHVGVAGEPRPGEELAELRSLAPERIRTWPHGTGPALRDWLTARGFQPRPLD